MKAFLLGAVIGTLLGCIGAPKLTAQAYDNSPESCVAAAGDNGGMHPNGLWQNGSICREGTGAIIWIRWTL
jgi:hypothetical protein